MKKLHAKHYGGRLMSRLLVSLLFGAVLLWPSMILAADCSIGAADVFCASCEVGDRCVTDGAERGTCQVVPEGTEDNTVSEGVVVRAGNKICTTDGTTPAMLPSSGDGEDGPEAPSAPIGPTFAINIPTVQLTATQTSQTADGEYYQVDIPWIADYITGVYRYAVFFGSVLAAVLLMVAGLQWLTAGGNASRVNAAKKRMVDATIGLVLILGTFLILNTVNPELTSLKPLRVKTVPSDPIDLELATTTVDTGQQGRSGDNSSYPIAGGQGTYTAKYFTSGCPVNLTESDTGRLPTPRNIQFFNLIHPILTGSTQEKFAKAYEAAWLCGVKIGSCGRTISDLATLVQIGPSAPCLSDSSYVTRRDKDGDPIRIGCMDEYLSRSDRTPVPGYREATRRSGASIRDVISELQSSNPGYPDSIAEQLRPGDIVTYFNGNSSGGGGHRVFVAGEVNERGIAELLNGSIGRPPYTSNRCFSSRCGNFAPIGYIDRLR